MTTWHRSDLWGNADARAARRALMWKAGVPFGVLAAWLLSVMRSIWDISSIIDFVEHVP